MWLDLDGLRVVHTCWDTRDIRVVQEGLHQHDGVTDTFLQLACTKGNRLFTSAEVVLKGKTLKLPKGLSFEDNDGHVRTSFRISRHLPIAGHSVRTYAFPSDVVDCGLSVEPIAQVPAEPYPAMAMPVFIGHYWLSAKEPAILADNVACVDYSVAKDGFLCAFRWNGEQKLTDELLPGLWALAMWVEE